MGTFQSRKVVGGREIGVNLLRRWHRWSPLPDPPHTPSRPCRPNIPFWRSGDIIMTHSPTGIFPTNQHGATRRPRLSNEACPTLFGLVPEYRPNLVSPQKAPQLLTDPASSLYPSLRYSSTGHHENTCTIVGCDQLHWKLFRPFRAEDDLDSTMSLSRHPHGSKD